MKLPGSQLYLFFCLKSSSVSQALQNRCVPTEKWKPKWKLRRLNQSSWKPFRGAGRCGYITLTHPGLSPSQSRLTLGYVRREGKCCPPLLHHPGRRCPARAEGLQPGQKAGEAFVATVTGMFRQTGKTILFSWKDEPEFSSFKGRRSWEEGCRRERALCENCHGQDEPTGSFPPQPAIQYYNSIRKGHSSIQMGSDEITLHLVLIRILHT